MKDCTIRHLALGMLVALAAIPAYAVTDYVEKNNEQIRQACILAGCDTPQQRPAVAPGIWGAIAVSNSTTLSGSAWGYQSQQAAANTALKECSIAMNAMRDCRVLGSFANACVALATSRAEHAWGYSGTVRNLQIATTAAITQCTSGGGKDCVVTAQFCSPGGEPSKPQYWGAIAVAPGTLHSGDGWNFSGKQDASARALKECAAAGGRDCIVVATAANDCVALAVSDAEKVYGTSRPARSIKSASDSALQQCQRRGGRSCKVTASLCADGNRR